MPLSIFSPNRIFASFNTFFSSIVQKKNAVIVGPSRQLTGEFPPIQMQDFYEKYYGWSQVKQGVDTLHTKFMGAGIDVKSKDERFNEFLQFWMKTVKFQQKISEFAMSGFITGNGIIEKQYTRDGRLGNIEQIPMQTIFRIFRDSYANEVKIVQIIDGVFKEIDPSYYVHWMIFNADRQAFGKSVFYSLAAPRRIPGKVDPVTGVSVNPDRSTISLLDAQALLQASEVEIKRIMAKPRILAWSQKKIPEQQIKEIEAEMQDDSSSKTIWFFDTEVHVEEASISNQGKYDKYGENVDKMIDLGLGTSSRSITDSGSMGYASSQTPFEIVDQKMFEMQADFIEKITDEILRSLAQSWGFVSEKRTFEELEVNISFKPIIRKPLFEDVLKIPSEWISPEEGRQFLKDANFNLNDDQWNAYKTKLEADKQAELDVQKQQPQMGKTPQGPQRPDIEDDRPKPSPNTLERIIKNPKVFEDYVQKLVLVEKRNADLRDKLHWESYWKRFSPELKVKIARMILGEKIYDDKQLQSEPLHTFPLLENVLILPQTHKVLESNGILTPATDIGQNVDLFAVRPDVGPPEITDNSITNDLLNKHASLDEPTKPEDMIPSEKPSQTAKQSKPKTKKVPTDVKDS